MIVRARLPAQLERWRRRAVASAADGVPAHATMLFPFVAPERLDGTVRRVLAGVAARHAPIEHRLVGPQRWPGVTYAGLDPVEPFVALHRDLQAAFPAFPIYGPAFDLEFMPHVTVDEGADIVRARRSRLAITAHAGGGIHARGDRPAARRPVAHDVADPARRRRRPGGHR